MPNWLISPTGEVVDILPEDTESALAYGFAMPSPEQAAQASEQRRLEAEYGGTSGGLKAALLGAGRGATMGISDWLLGNTVMTPEEIQAFKTQNPVASGVGDVAGMVATAPFLAGKVGKLAKAKTLLSGKKAEELAALANESGGFTYSPLARAAPTEGFALSVHPEAERVLGKALTGKDVSRFAYENVDDLLRGQSIGAWKADQGARQGQMILDLSQVEKSKATALEKALKAQQDAVFNLGQGESIPATREGIAAAQAAEPAGDALAAMSRTPLNQIARKALAQGVGSAAETSTYALGHLVSEAALGDPNLTAESAVSDVGLSALLGFGIGAGPSAVWNLAKRSFGGNAGKRIAGMLENVESNAYVRSTGASPSQVRRVMEQKDINRLVADAKELGIVDNLVVTDRSILAKATAKADEIYGELGSMYSLLDSKLAPESVPKIQSLVMKAKARILAPMRDNPMPAANMAANRFQRMLDDSISRVGSAEGRVSATGLWKLRHQLDGEINWAKLNMPVTDYQASLIKFRGQITDTLDDLFDRTPGLPAGTRPRWRQLNRQYESAATLRNLALDGVHRSAASPSISFSGKLGGLAGAIAGGGLGGAAVEGAVSSMLGGGPLMGAVVGAGAMEALRRYGAGAVGKAAGFARGAFSGGGGSLSAGSAGPVILGGAEAAAADLIASSGTDGALRNLVEKTSIAIAQERSLQPFDPTLASLGPGPVETSAETIGDNPRRAAVLSQLDRMHQSVDKRLDIGVGNAIRGSVQGHEKPGSTIRTSDPDTPRDLNRVEAIRNLISSQDRIADLLAEQVDGWHEHAPATAVALGMATMRALTHLSSRLPEYVQPGPLAQPIPPSRAAMAEFRRTWDIVDDPFQVMKYATDGSLTERDVQTISEVYPALYTKMRAGVFDRLTTHRGAIPYRQRAALSKLVGVDLDGTQGAAMVASNQAAYASHTVNTPPPPSGGDKPGGPVTVGQRSKTETQQRRS